MADRSSIDCNNTSDLLCTETNSLWCLDGPDWGTPDDDQTRTQQIGIKRNRSEPSMMIGLPLLSEEVFWSMIKAESEHLPRNDYVSRFRSGDLDMGVRKEAFDWISKTQAYYNFGPLSICLSMNYLDRFLSVHELPREKSWTVQLLAVACLSIAVKVEENAIPLNVDLQFVSLKEGEELPKFVFEGKAIQRMELLLMSTLKWRMQASTPLSFIDFFLRRNMNRDGEFEPNPMMISRSIEIILSTIKGIDFLEFKPSEIAAAVSMFVLEELDDTNVDKEMSASSCLEKGRVLKCVQVMKDLLKMTSSAAAAAAAAEVVPESPNAVLEGGACLSHKSSDIGAANINSSMNNNGSLLLLHLHTNSLHPTSSSSS